VRFDEEDPFVPVWEGPLFDAELIRLRLEEAHIPVDFGEALLPGEARVEVPRSYLEEVRDVVNGVAARWPDLSERGPGGIRVKPSVDLGTRAIAAILAVSLVIGSAIVVITLLWH
jgi:hypothetical protein